MTGFGEKTFHCIVIGYGERTRRVLLPAIRTLGGVVTAIVEDDPHVRSTIKTDRIALQISEQTAVLENIPSRGDEVFAMIATPHGTHSELTLDAIEQGYFVLKEKPFAASFEEARLLATHSNRIHVLVTRPYVPEFEWIRHSLQRIGPSLAYDYSYIRKTSDYRTTWRNNPSLAGGGVVLDMGYHVIELLLRLFGEIVISDALSGRSPRRPGYLVEEEALLRFSHHDAYGTLRVSRLGAMSQEEWFVEGLNGTLRCQNAVMTAQHSGGRETRTVRRNAVECATFTLREGIRKATSSYADERLSNCFPELEAMRTIARFYDRRQQGLLEQMR